MGALGAKTEDGWLVQQVHYELAQVRRDQIHV